LWKPPVFSWGSFIETWAFLNFKVSWFFSRFFQKNPIFPKLLCIFYGGSWVLGFLWWRNDESDC
jgi:hypothetical protein